MNLLKSKLGIFSLLAVFGISLFLTSCNDDNPQPSPQPQVEEEQEQTDIMFLQTIDDAEIEAIVAGATQEEMIQYRNNYLTFQYLEEIDKLDEGFIITGDNTFAFNLDVLTSAERANLEGILVKPGDRGCLYVGVYGCATVPWVCFKWGIPYPCTKRKCAGLSGYVCW